MVSSILLGAVLRVSNLSNVGLRTPDERTYAAQAVVLLHEGLPGVRRLATEYVNDPNRFYPPPSRIGYTGLIAGMMSATKQSDALIGAWLSCLASIAGLCVVALIGLRFFDPWVGGVATFLLATFPPDLVIARRAWSDAWVSCLTYVLLYCSFSIARGDRSRSVALAFLAAGGTFVMMKETSAMVWGLCILWVLVCQRKASIRIVAASVVAGMLSLAFLSWVIGGVSVLWDIQSRLTTFHVANPYALEYQSGPPYWLLKSYWIMSPWTFSFALLGLVSVPWVSSWRDRRSAAGVSGFAAIVLALPFVLPSWLNLRYSSPAFGPLCILAAAAFRLGIGSFRERLPTSVVSVVVALSCVGLASMGIRDYRYFTRWFVSAETADLSVRMVFETAGEEGALPPLGASLPGTAEQESPSAIAERSLNASMALFQQKRFDDAIAAARQALALRPGYAEAYNNIAAAFAEKGMWDEAIQAAEEAVRLKPDFQLAKNNLAWARAEKAKEKRMGTSTEPR